MISLDTVLWKNGRLVILDQTLLPLTRLELELSTQEGVWEAIKALRVRGAPAIGICAAYGVLVGIRQHAPGTPGEFRECALRCMEYLATSRPTAVNLFYALDRMRATLERQPPSASIRDLFDAMEREADALFREDDAMCRAIGSHGAPLIREGSGVLTHCNAGGLATSGYGTALAPMYTAHEQGRRFRVFADETRPLLQGARLTAWELQAAGLDVTLLCDNMAAAVMKSGKIHLVIVGADRIAANGDTANKIGTYGVAVLARHHGIPFYVAAPASTFDLQTRDGGGIPIEERDAEEVRTVGSARTAPPDVPVYNPAFDVTPAELITGFITDKGILAPPFSQSIVDVLFGGLRPCS